MCKAGWTHYPCFAFDLDLWRISLTLWLIYLTTSGNASMLKPPVTWGKNRKAAKDSTAKTNPKQRGQGRNQRSAFFRNSQRKTAATTVLCQDCTGNLMWAQAKPHTTTTDHMCCLITTYFLFHVYARDLYDKSLLHTVTKGWNHLSHLLIPSLV